MYVYLVPLFFDAGAKELSKTGMSTAGLKTYETNDMILKDYSQRIKLRNNHESRPLTVFPDGFIGH